MRVVHADAKREGRGRREDAAAVVPEQASSDVSPEQLDARAHDDLHAGPRPEHVDEFRKRRQRGGKVSVPEADEFRMPVERRQDAQLHRPRLSGVLLERQDHDLAVAARRQVGEYRRGSIRTAVVHEDQVDVGSARKKAKERLGPQPFGFVVARDHEL